MKPKRVILCPNPYRDSELKVCKQSRDMLESLGMQTSVCLPFQREGYGEELGLSMRPLQQEIRQAELDLEDALREGDIEYSFVCYERIKP